jgi:hypothetical protein
MLAPYVTYVKNCSGIFRIANVTTTTIREIKWVKQKAYRRLFIVGMAL